MSLPFSIGSNVRTLEDRVVTPLRGTLGRYSIYRPIFVVAPPRSGSTFLFNCIASAAEVTAFTHREADHIWWRVKPYSGRRALSDYLAPDEVDDDERRRLKASFYVEATRHAAVRGGRFRALPDHLGTRAIRYLDKTISNCFHLQLLIEMFPDAEFVFLVRDPRDNIASMLSGWHEGRFRKRQLDVAISAVERSSVPYWTYPAPPGWMDVVSWPLHEICAWSWKQHILWMLNRPASIRAHWVRYEDITAGPEAMEDLFNRLALSWDSDIEAYARSAPLSRTTVTPPLPGKWRHTRRREIESVLPMIADTAGKIGYDVDSP